MKIKWSVVESGEVHEARTHDGEYLGSIHKYRLVDRWGWRIFPKQGKLIRHSYKTWQDARKAFRVKLDISNWMRDNPPIESIGGNELSLFVADRIKDEAKKLRGH